MAEGIHAYWAREPKIPLDDFPQVAKRIRSDEVYDVFDLAERLRHLTVSQTVLHAGKSTKGHSHDNQEEIYYFLDGTGEMELGHTEAGDYKRFPVGPEDLVLIPAKVFHRVHNRMDEGDLRVLCIFEKYGEREQEAQQAGQ